MLDHSTASRVLSVVYATKAITKIIYRIALGRSRGFAVTSMQKR